MTVQASIAPEFSLLIAMFPVWILELLRGTGRDVKWLILTDDMHASF